MDVTPTIQHLHGRLRSITGTDPAAGAEISEIVPARTRWRLISIYLSLTTDTTVINRRIRLIIENPTNSLFQIYLSTLQTASATWYYSFSKISTPETRVFSRIYIPIPTFILPTLSNIRTVTDNLQAGDNYGTPQILVEEWIDP